jgi:hypothetical protein
VYADIAQHSDDVAALMGKVHVFLDEASARAVYGEIARLQPPTWTQVEAAEKSGDAALIAKVTSAWEALHRKVLAVGSFPGPPRRASRGELGPGEHFGARICSPEGVTAEDLEWADDVVLCGWSDNSSVLERWSGSAPGKGVLILQASGPGLLDGVPFPGEMRITWGAGYWPKPGRTVWQDEQTIRGEVVHERCTACDGTGRWVSETEDGTCVRCDGRGIDSYEKGRVIRHAFREWESGADILNDPPLRTGEVDKPVPGRVSVRY